jgi:hypothetical protein
MMVNARVTDLYVYGRMHIEGVERIEPPVVAPTEKA